MRYCIMCGNNYPSWKYPRHLTKIYDETLVERTIRLLLQAGVDDKDILVTTTENSIAEFRDVVPNYVVLNNNEGKLEGYWVECFHGFNSPCTYLCGDVVFSPEAIKKIVETETDDIEFFASAPPFAKNYLREWAEPFAFKVVNQTHLKDAQFQTVMLAKQGKFKRRPSAWEFWQIVKGTLINQIDYTNYTVINDYTCDIDKPDDIKQFEGAEQWHTT